MTYLYLAISIVADVIGTIALKASDGMTHLNASIMVLVFYTASFYFLSLVIKAMPVGVAYAMWSGMGIVLISLVSAYTFRQLPDLPAVIGMGLILAGVLVINLYSKDVVS